MGIQTYEFCAIFYYADDGISIDFPDLPGCISCGYSNDQALKMAKEALELYLDGMSESEIPKARQITEIKITNSNQKIIPIKVENVT